MSDQYQRLIPPGQVRRRRSFHLLADDGNNGHSSMTSATPLSNIASSPVKDKENKPLNSWASGCESSDLDSSIPYGRPAGFGQVHTEPGQLPSIAHDFCKPCKKARLDPGFSKRVSELYRPLYCTVCEREHPLAQFPPSQRHANASERKCIAHSASICICKHVCAGLAWVAATTNPVDWSKYEWPDKNGRPRVLCNYDSDGSIVIQCNHQDHALPKGVDDSKYRDYPFKLGVPTFAIRNTPTGSFAIRSTFAADPQLQSPALSSEEEHKACIDTVVKTLLDQNFCFCPHVLATHDRIKIFQFYQQVGTTQDYQYKCPRCDLSITFHLGEENRRRAIPPIEIEGRMECRPGDGGVDAHKQLIHQLIPSRFPITSDAEGKNITWCKSTSCATNFEYAFLTAVLDGIEGIPVSSDLDQLRSFMKTLSS